MSIYHYKERVRYNHFVIFFSIKLTKSTDKIYQRWRIVHGRSTSKPDNTRRSPDRQPQKCSPLLSPGWGCERLQAILQEAGKATNNHVSLIDMANRSGVAYRTVKKAVRHFPQLEPLPRLERLPINVGAMFHIDIVVHELPTHGYDSTTNCRRNWHRIERNVFHICARIRTQRIQRHMNHTPIME